MSLLEFLGNEEETNKDIEEVIIMEDTLNDVKELLEFKLGDINTEIGLHKKYNASFDPLGDSFTEMLHAAMYGSRCTGSAGSGWDTLDKGESKFSNRLQSRKCESCGSKVMFFLNECADCGSPNLSSYPKDSRWGIASKSHLEYVEELNGYRVMLLEPESFDPDCRTFILRSWVIDAKDEYLTEYANRQFNSEKSNHINFMPLGQDFYRSSPWLHMKATITMDSITINYFDITNTTPEIVPEKFNIKSMEEIMEGKTFGKNRGITSRK